MMTRGKLLFGLVLLGSVISAGCEVFEDQTPEFITFRMDGPAGETVQMIYSKQFVAGVNQEGRTRIEVFGADTVVHTLPFDTILDVRIERQLFLQGRVLTGDTLNVGVDIEVDGRGLFNSAGQILPGVPWLFLYRFNTRFTQDIDVVV